MLCGSWKWKLQCEMSIQTVTMITFGTKFGYVSLNASAGYHMLLLNQRNRSFYWSLPENDLLKEELLWSFDVHRLLSVHTFLNNVEVTLFIRSLEVLSWWLLVSCCIWVTLGKKQVTRSNNRINLVTLKRPNSFIQSSWNLQIFVVMTLSTGHVGWKISSKVSS